MFHFTEYVTDPATRYLLAFNFLYFIAADIILNILVLIFVIIKKIFSACMSFFARRRAKKNMEQKTQAEIKNKNELKNVLQVDENKRRAQIASYFNQSSSLDTLGINICGAKIYRNKIPPTQLSNEDREPVATTE